MRNEGRAAALARAWSDAGRPRRLASKPKTPKGSGQMSDQPNVRPAGEGLSDEEMVEQVAGQTASDLKYSDVFERESDGATTDVEAAKASAEELAGD